MLGGFLALLSAATFALNNASVRRGVLTGSVLQGMAITVPIGVPLFFIAAAATGSLDAVGGFPIKAVLALAAAGILHFVWGRYCNYRAMRAIGTNLDVDACRGGPSVAITSLYVLLGVILAALFVAIGPW